MRKKFFKEHQFSNNTQIHNKITLKITNEDNIRNNLIKQWKKELYSKKRKLKD